MEKKIKRTAAKSKSWLGRVPSYVLLSLWSAFAIFCVLWLVLTSFKTNRELFKNVWALPTHFVFANYVKAWQVVRMGDYFVNSIVIVFASIALILAISTPASYVLSRFTFVGRKLVTNIFIAGMGIPTPLLFIPLFVILSSLHLISTLPGLVLVYMSLSIPFTVYLLTGFFVTLPSELEESAVIDGASELTIFTRVMLPLATPGIITAAIFNFITLWNEYMLALVYISEPDRRPLSLGLYSLSNSMQYTGDWVGLYAGAVIVVVPTIILYIVLSERMIEGITMGASKG
jgi:N-acetylglucosamine transport system permease protein